MRFGAHGFHTAPEGAWIACAGKAHKIDDDGRAEACAGAPQGSLCRARLLPRTLSFPSEIEQATAVRMVSRGCARASESSGVAGRPARALPHKGHWRSAAGDVALELAVASEQALHKLQSAFERQGAGRRGQAQKQLDARDAKLGKLKKRLEKRDVED